MTVSETPPREIKFSDSYPPYWVSWCVRLWIKFTPEYPFKHTPISPNTHQIRDPTTHTLYTHFVYRICLLLYQHFIPNWTLIISLWLAVAWEVEQVGQYLEGHWAACYPSCTLRYPCTRYPKLFMMSWWHLAWQPMPTVDECLCEWVNVTSFEKRFKWSVHWKKRHRNASLFIHSCLKQATLFEY